MESIITTREEVESLGFSIQKELPSTSAPKVYLAERKDELLVVKRPEEGWGELLALRTWSGTAAPLLEDLPGDLFAMEHLRGDHPFRWTEDDVRKISEMMSLMYSNQPISTHTLRPLDDRTEIICHRLWQSNLPQKREAVRSIQEALSKHPEELLIHGDLHPFNIFVNREARCIDPYGLLGDPGFDLAFLAVSVADRQEVLLEKLIENLGFESARDWFPGLALYRLENTLRHKKVSESRALGRLVDRLWPL